MRASVFDDPGDEKSWHVSQRSTSLIRYFEGREPSWYASAVAPLKGAARVLDLGCGPGLALRALLDQGSSAVLGIERWPAFVAGSTPEAPIIAHDLSLPMPFLESGSFDGVLSHYVLDYVSPVCVRQVLREAHRLLAPGGRLVLFLAGMGLGGGDESRTISYSPRVLRLLLEEAGFAELEVEASPNGRNSVARATRSPGPGERPRARGPVAAGGAEPSAAIDGDTQLSASFPRGADRLRIELAGEERGAAFSVDLPAAAADDGVGVSACLRALRLRSGGSELRLTAWRGHRPLAGDSARVEFPVTGVRIAGPAGGASHVSVWRPGGLSLEPPGNAYARAAELPAGADLSEAERGAEGRQMVVERAEDGPVESWDRLGPGRNRFLIRLASRVDVATLERQWLAAQLHGVAVAAAELEGELLRELLLWSGWRQSLLYLGGADWEGILAVASRRRDEMAGPVVLVDPALAPAAPAHPLDSGVAAFAAAEDRFFVLLGADALEAANGDDLARLSRRLLVGGPRRPEGAEARAADETLRYLTERALLMRLRAAHGCSWAEVGRRPVPW